MLCLCNSAAAPAFALHGLYKWETAGRRKELPGVFLLLVLFRNKLWLAVQKAQWQIKVVQPLNGRLCNLDLLRREALWKGEWQSTCISDPLSPGVQSSVKKLKTPNSVLCLMLAWDASGWVRQDRICQSRKATCSKQPVNGRDPGVPQASEHTSPSGFRTGINKLEVNAWEVHWQIQVLGIHFDSSLWPLM